ncbi:MAG TPA: Stp1/IreP family PP2C-type Ser/Thr phosphatase [Pseudomonadales bacterium]|nr:Stp1/IreP family PP2C-type Ser/Thr phosphatase [Gammaproteobacteria bacterium]HSG90760.1 Stp1/IreP family PP2C-type Ser/Thr phosphatase [Pseudomonadales bacterium]
MSLRGKIAIAGLTDTGLVRDHNEDAIRIDDGIGLVVLADGMGGLKAGEVASAMAVDVIARDVRDVLKGIDAGQSDAESGYAYESLAVGRAVIKANETIFHVAQTQPQCAGMGTTLVVLLFYDNRLTVAHVGDSRLYRLREGTMEQVTTDHSLVQELVERGFYTPAEARAATNKNIVTRALGIGPEVDYDMQEDVALVGDTFLLCSDGLSDMLEDAQIHTILRENQDNLDEAARMLVNAANECGGRDNISVVLARVDRSFPVRSGWFSRLVNWFD